LFSYISFSQGSVATYATSGGILNNSLLQIYQKNIPLKKFGKSIKTWQSYGHEFVASLFGI